MLDVHPPHAPTHTWKDFFIHIATIVIGLLIAVGLEQTVEWMHHRHGVERAREHIHAEVEVNERIRRDDQQQADLIIARLKGDLDILQVLDANNGKPQAADLNFTWNGQGFYSAALNSARDSGALALMPYEESAMYSDAYLQGSVTTDAMFETYKKIYAAKAILHDRPVTSLSPPERQSLYAATAAALGQADYLKVNLDIAQQEWEAILSGNFRNDIGGTGK
jgi:hypothetical protein